MLTLRLTSFLGFFAMLFVAWLLSTHRWKINRRILMGGILLQFALAFAVMKTAPGYFVFHSIGEFFRSIPAPARSARSNWGCKPISPCTAATASCLCRSS